MEPRIYTPGEIVVVKKPWWIKVEQLQCEVISDPGKGHYVTVKPLTGNTHSRYVRREQIEY